ncbi:glycerophosphodiester phosphodiesterase [Bifidobacterium gallicum]|nr:glycerophosphodiester phosphodiesterase [Bifidobacterium gallicum]
MERERLKRQSVHAVTDAVSKQLNVALDKMNRKPMFAHRGFVADKSVVPNSFQAFDAAIKNNCPQVELDIRTSKDGVYYINHDATLNAVAGIDRRVDEMTSKELDSVRMRNGERLHRLSELFDRYGTKLYYLIEFKESDASAIAFRNLLARYPQLVNRVEVQSFYPGILSRLDGILPNLYKQLLVGRQSTLTAHINDDYLDSMAIAKHMAKPATIAQIHDKGKEVWTWTLERSSVIERNLADGVDGVITDSSTVARTVRNFNTKQSQKAKQAAADRQQQAQ